MPYYPNQQPRPRAIQNAKHLNDQVLADKRLQGAREAAKRLRSVVHGARHRMRDLLKKLEHIEHGPHEDHRTMEGAENLDHIAHELEKLSHETHTEIAHSPASHMPEYHQGEFGPEAGLFQLLGLILVVLKRIQHMRSHSKSKKAKETAGEAKRVLNEVKAAAKKR